MRRRRQKGIPSLLDVLRRLRRREPLAPPITTPLGAAGTTTIESKTNFMAAGRAGVVRAKTKPLHRGRPTMGWQTRVTDEVGRLLLVTTPTQMVRDGR